MNTSKIQEYKPQYIGYDGGFISDHPGERYYNDDGNPDPTVEPQRPEALVFGSPIMTATQAQAAQQKAYTSLRVLADLKASVINGSIPIATATATAKRILLSLINEPALNTAIAKGNGRLLAAKSLLITSQLALSNISSADATSTSSTSFTDTLESVTNSIANLADAYSSITKSTQTTAAAPAPAAPAPSKGLSTSAWIAIGGGGLALVVLAFVLASKN